jgi:RNA polymerase sigma-70 factor (ECF subfamily)
MAEPPFEKTIEQCRDGDEDAWSRIFAGLAPIVLGYLRANGAAEPEDVLSETFLQIARDVGRFEGDERGFRAWVFSIAHHRLIDAQRSAARRPADPVAEPPEPHGAEVADDAATEAMARIGAEEIREVLAVLSADQRAVLTLRILGDLTVAQVASVIGKRPGAVKALQRRGLATVQRELERRGVPL